MPPGESLKKERIRESRKEEEWVHPQVNVLIYTSIKFVQLTCLIIEIAKIKYYKK